MPRRSIERPAGKAGIIDMKTGRPAAPSSLPILCGRIRFFRERAGMEQKILAGKIGVTANAVSNWENGRGRPDINLLPDICRALEISMEELFGLEAPAGTAGPEELTFLDRCRLLTPGHRLAVDRMVDTLLKVHPCGALSPTANPSPPASAIPPSSTGKGSPSSSIPPGRWISPTVSSP